MRIAWVCLVLAACAPDFKLPSRMLASDVPAPREPIAERRASYYDLAATRLRREWHVLIQPDNTTVLNGRDVRFYADASPEYEREYDHDEPTGTWRSWWPNGNPRMEASYGTTDARPMRWWHENGQLSSEGMARNGVKDGPWTFWHPNGTKASEGPYAAGQRQGEWRFWNEAGELVEQAAYRADVKVERG